MSVSRCIPYARAGRSLWYATSVERDGFANGLLVGLREGHPIAIQGHPEHPASLRPTAGRAASMLTDLFGPHRLSHLEVRRRPRPWSTLVGAIGERRDRGAGLRVVLPPTASPLRLRLLDKMIDRLPAARWSFAANLVDAQTEASERAFGGHFAATHRIDRADLVVVLDGDPVGEGPAAFACADAVARRRSEARAGGRAFELWAAEPSPTATGGCSDRRVAVPASEVPRLLLAILDALAIEDADLADLRGRAVPTMLSPAAAAWAVAAADAMLRARGRSLLIVGDRQPAAAHVLAHAIDAALGNLGRTRGYVAALIPGAARGQQSALMTTAELESGEVDTLVLLEVDPARTGAYPRLPKSLDAMKLVRLCDRRDDHAWVIPPLHPFEAWGVGRAFDGTLTMRQPIVAPRRPARSAEDVLAVLAGSPAASARALLGEHWPAIARCDLQEALRRGFVPGTAAPWQTPTFRVDAARDAIAELRACKIPPLELALATGSSVVSPHVATIGPATAAALGVGDGDALQLEVATAAMTATVRVARDHAERSISVPLVDDCDRASEDAWRMLGEVRQRIRSVRARRPSPRDRRSA